jgi:hypothetical protein
MKHFPIVSALIFCVSLVQAHEGQGLPGGAHWHANDALLLIALLTVAAAGLWLNRKK